MKSDSGDDDDSCLFLKHPCGFSVTTSSEQSQHYDPVLKNSVYDAFNYLQIFVVVICWLVVIKILVFLR